MGFKDKEKQSEARKAHYQKKSAGSINKIINLLRVQAPRTGEQQN